MNKLFALLVLAMVLMPVASMADGTDPVPLCHSGVPGCPAAPPPPPPPCSGTSCSTGGHKLIEQANKPPKRVILADGTDPMPVCRNGKDATGRPCGGSR